MSYNDITAVMTNALSNFYEKRKEWGETTNEIFAKTNSNITENATLPSKPDLINLQNKIVNLISAINDMPNPTNGIENSSFIFKSALNDIIRAIGSYDDTPEGMTKIVVRSQQASEVGAIYSKEIDSYLGSTFHRMWSSL